MRNGVLAELNVIDETYGIPDTRSDCVLIFMLKGSMTIETEKKKTFLKEDDLFLINNGDSFETKSDGMLAATLRIAMNELTILTGVAHSRFLCSTQDDQGEKYDSLREKVKNILAVHINRDPSSRVREAEFCYEAVWYLLSEFRESIAQEGVPQDDQERLEFILGYIHTNYARQISLQELADLLYLSSPYLSKYIKKKLGCGFNDYVNRVRLDHAVEELEDKDHSVTRVALDNGFPNMASFNRVFRQKYKVTPSEYKAGTKRRRSQAVLDSKDETDEKGISEYLSNNPLKDANMSISRSHNIEADAAIHEPYDKHWLEVISLCAAADLQRVDIQQGILQLKRIMNFKYGRIWSIFSQDLSIDINSKRAFNFARIDQVLDFLVHNDIIPFIDVGFRGKSIISSIGKNVVMNEPVNARFSSNEQYGRLISEFIRHCRQRYGTEELEKWKIEFWWHRQGEEKISSHWYTAFSILYRNVKSYVPKMKVGGFGFNIFDQNRSIENYLIDSKNDPIRPDFLSVVLFPYQKRKEDIDEEPTVNADRDFVKKELETLRALVRKYDYPEDCLYITEWNSSISSRNYLHDSCYKGAWIMKNLIDSVGLVKVLSYWGSTDRAYEYFDSVRFLNGAPGLLTRDGIHKSAMWAYDFMNTLENELIMKDDNCMITSREHGIYSICCHNFCQIGPEYFFRYSEDIDCSVIPSLFRDETLTLDITIRNAENGSYRITKRYINVDSGSVFNEWLRLGDLESSGEEERRYLHAVSIPHHSFETVHVEDGRIHLHVAMKTNEICNLRIIKQD